MDKLYFSVRETWGNDGRIKHKIVLSALKGNENLHFGLMPSLPLMFAHQLGFHAPILGMQICRVLLDYYEGLHSIQPINTYLKAIEYQIFRREPKSGYILVQYIPKPFFPHDTRGLDVFAYDQFFRVLFAGLDEEIQNNIAEGAVQFINNYVDFVFNHIPNDKHAPMWVFLSIIVEEYFKLLGHPDIVRDIDGNPSNKTGHLTHNMKLLASHICERWRYDIPNEDQALVRKGNDEAIQMLSERYLDVAQTLGI